MSQSDKVFAGAVPAFYNSHLVPLIFEAFAEDLAERIAALSPHDVLETAAGTGVVTRALAAKLAPDARYVVTDLNAPMLDLAAKLQGADPRISWQQADALQLPFADAAFDAVCCQFGVMFFPDRVAGYREAKRVLRPEGAFAFNVWDRIEANDFSQEITAALADLFPEDPPRFMVRTPHGYHDPDLIRDELRAAGFSDVAIERKTEQSRAPSPEQAATAYCQGTPLRGEIEARGASRLQEATDRAAAALRARFGAGEIVGQIQGFVITARA